MLTEKQKSILGQVFAAKDAKELTLEEAGKMAAETKMPLKAVEWFALQKHILPGRYLRNIGSIGVEGQSKLLNSKVIVVGLGGLGGYVCEELARAGVGHITVVDGDVFDESNLNRQMLANEGNLGEKKVVEAQKRLKKVNKAIEFEGFAKPLDKVEEEIWRRADLVFDCLDNIKDRFVLENKCSSANVPMVHGAIAGWYGEVGVVWPGTKMLEKIYKSQTKGMEQELGTPAFTAATAASVMAAEGVKILTGKNASREQKVFFFDLLEGEWESVTF